MKKIIVLTVSAVMALALATGCLGNSTAATKSEYETTVFADAALEEAITSLAKTYTAADGERSSYSILLSYKESDALTDDIITKGAYCDFIISTPEAMDKLDSASGGNGSITSSTRADFLLSSETGEVAFSVAFLSGSDRVEVSTGSLDYLKSSEGESAFANAGLTLVK